MDGGAQWAAVCGVAGSRTRLSDFTFTFHFHALEKEMVIHSSGSCLENPRDGGAWWAAVYGVTQSRTQLKRLSSSSSSIPGIKQYIVCFLLLCFFLVWSIGLLFLLSIVTLTFVHVATWISSSFLVIAE